MNEVIYHFGCFMVFVTFMAGLVLMLIVTVRAMRGDESGK